MLEDKNNNLVLKKLDFNMVRINDAAVSRRDAALIDSLVTGPEPESQASARRKLSMRRGACTAYHKHIRELASIYTWQGVLALCLNVDEVRAILDVHIAACTPLEKPIAAYVQFGASFYVSESMMPIQETDIDVVMLKGMLDLFLNTTDKINIKINIHLPDTYFSEFMKLVHVYELNENNYRVTYTKSFFDTDNELNSVMKRVDILTNLLGT